MLKLNAFQLKWIAIIGMVLHHAIYPFQDVLPLEIMIPLYVAGGVTFPILAYFIVEGYKYTSNLKAYMARLAIVGVISMPFHFMVYGRAGFNIMFTIVVSLFCLVLYDYIKSKPVFYTVFVLICIITASFFDWFAFGPIVVLLYHIIKNETARRVVPGIFAGVAWLVLSLFTWRGIVGLQQLYNMGGEATFYAEWLMDMIYASMGNENFIFSSLFFIIGCAAGALLVLGYNGDRGRKMKWIFYSFYPLHLAAIALLAFVL